LISQQVDGVIIAPYDSDAENLHALRRRDIPTVIIDRRVKGWDLDSVMGDSFSGARALVRHLIDLGHRRIAILSGPTQTSTAEDRVAGYCAALVEAGIPVDPRLIKRGEFRNTMGEAQTYEVLDTETRPTAIFAGNNAIAMGVIDALGKRGLRIPQDVALVSVDDLPDVSNIFPFLTVVSQPAYDIGVNAAQLLLSRLDSDVKLRPRHVALPSRLIVRQSCGSKMTGDGQSSLSLPIVSGEPVESKLIKPLSTEERRGLTRHLGDKVEPPPPRLERLADHDRSDVNRLLKALQHREADRVPYIEFQVIDKKVYEYVLEYELEDDPISARISGQAIAPEDHVEFAQRLGMDAVPCHFAWQPTATDPHDLEPPPSLLEQISYLERYLRAVQGTPVGVIASFDAFFRTALRAMGLWQDPERFAVQRSATESLMDAIIERQQRIVRVLCDRFGSDLALVMFRDDVARDDGLVLPPELLAEVFGPRMARLAAPAKEHGKLLWLHSRGKVADALDLLARVGIDALSPIEPEWNDIFEIKARWAGKLALVGNVPSPLLEAGTPQGIDEAIRDYCIRMAPGGGYVLSSAGGITAGIPAENLVAMTQAVHKYGHYGSLGARRFPDLSESSRIQRR
jgi:LacI family transcriptional regulator